MKPFLPILPLCFALNAFGQDSLGFTNKAEAKNQMVNGKKEGKWCEYWDDSTDEKVTDTSSAMYILTTYIHGKETGIERWYYHNGKIEAIVPYEHGIENGEEKRYYVNGKLEKVIPVVNGKINGEVKWYYESGILMNEAEYINGKQEKSINFDYTGKEIK